MYAVANVVTARCQEEGCGDRGAYPPHWWV